MNEHGVNEAASAKSVAGKSENSLKNTRASVEFMRNVNAN